MSFRYERSVFATYLVSNNYLTPQQYDDLIPENSLSKERVHVLANMFPDAFVSFMARRRLNGENIYDGFNEWLEDRNSNKAEDTTT